MKRVLLLNMPFGSIQYPSPALALLKSILAQQEIPCDVLYLNVLFQAYTRRPDIYEGVSDFMILGEWVFGQDLFGADWAADPRSQVDCLAAPFLPDGLNRKGIQSTLNGMRQLVDPFLNKCMEQIPWDDYDVVGFTSVYSQQVASLALARRIKRRCPDKIIAFGGANCEEQMSIAAATVSFCRLGLQRRSGPVFSPGHPPVR